MHFDSIRSLIHDDFIATDGLITTQLQSDIPLIQELSKHIIESGGKRLRPLLVLLSAHAFGYKGNHHVTLAAIIELIHTATLLHDDVVDASKLRRGKASANSIWGNEASVLVGDYLYSRAFQLMISVNNMPIFEILAEAANTLAAGEVLQLVQQHNPDTDEAKYMQVIQSKTAKLFEVAAKTGAILAERNLEEVNAIAQYGMHLGTAFQLVDDALDYCATSEEFGKNLGDDLAEGKTTLPLIYSMQHGTPEQVALIRQAIIRGNSDCLSEIIQVIESTDAIAYTYRAACEQVDAAITVLDIIPKSPYQQALCQLARFAVERKY